MITVASPGDFTKTLKSLELMKNGKAFDVLNSYGPLGVQLLSSATPVETGETAHSWEYEVSHSKGRHILSWSNTHVENGVNIAIILQYGHGTGTGGYVQGIDYINPVMRPLFDKMADDIWKQVTNA